MNTDAIVLIIGSVVVACIALAGVVLQSRSGFQSASLDTIVKQFQAISAENTVLRAERDKAVAEADKWRKAFDACEKRLPTTQRRRAPRDAEAD